MHFPIIILEKPDTDVDNWDIDVPTNDACIESHTDYTGGLYDKQERNDVINSPWLRDLLDGYATLDTEKETITFLDKDMCDRRFKDYLEDFTKDLYEKAQERTLDHYDLIDLVENYKGYWCLFVVETFCETSLRFVDYAKWRAGKTYRIGNIVDAHY